MVRWQGWGLLFMVSVLWPAATAAMDPESLHEQLATAVAAKNWPVALAIVQTLQVVQPERALELQRYEERLRVLAGSPAPLPLPTLPPTAAASAGEPGDLIPKIFIQNAKDAVKSTRSVRQGEMEITYPETYQIDFTFQAPAGYATQEIPVRIRVNGNVGFTVYRQIQLGSSRSAEIQFEFSVWEEPQPRFVVVEIPGGQRRTFPLDLPSRHTPLARRLVN